MECKEGKKQKLALVQFEEERMASERARERERERENSYSSSDWFCTSGPVLPSCAHSLFCDERRVSFLGKRVLLVNLLFVRLRQSPQKSEKERETVCVSEKENKVRGRESFGHSLASLSLSLSLFLN